MKFSAGRAHADRRETQNATPLQWARQGPRGRCLQSAPMPSAPLRRRLSWTLVLLAWLMQLGLPVAHAAMAGAPGGAMAAWCGEPANAREAAASLPDEIRDALARDAIGADHLASCAQLCAVGTTPAPWPAPGATPRPGGAGSPRPPAPRAPFAARRPALPPPPRGPPPRA